MKLGEFHRDNRTFVYVYILHSHLHPANVKVVRVVVIIIIIVAAAAATGVVVIAATPLDQLSSATAQAQLPNQRKPCSQRLLLFLADFEWSEVK